MATNIQAKIHIFNFTAAHFSIPYTIVNKVFILNIRHHKSYSHFPDRMVLKAYRSVPEQTIKGEGSAYTTASQVLLISHLPPFLPRSFPEAHPKQKHGTTEKHGERLRPSLKISESRKGVPHTQTINISNFAGHTATDSKPSFFTMKNIPV